jgi:hypothetical protein
LARCRALGIDLAAGKGGALLWEWQADADPPAGLLADLARHKARLLALLPPAPATPEGLSQAGVAAEFFHTQKRALVAEPAGLSAADRAWVARAIEADLRLPAGTVEVGPWPAGCAGCLYCCPCRATGSVEGPLERSAP